MADTAYAALVASADMSRQQGTRVQLTDEVNAVVADVWTCGRLGLVLVLYYRKDGLFASEVYSSFADAEGHWWGLITSPAMCSRLICKTLKRSVKLSPVPQSPWWQNQIPWYSPAALKPTKDMR